MLAARHGVTDVAGTRIAVVAVERRAGRARARLARLRAVAHVPVATRGPVRDRGVLAALHRVAGVGGAGVVVVAVGEGARGADAGLTRLAAVAHVPVAARDAVRRGGVLTAEYRVAGVGGARVVIVAVG